MREPRPVEYLRLFRHDIVNAAGDPYMQRWLARTPRGYLRLHHILRSDDDRVLHDHPFDFTSVVVQGRCIEHTPADPRNPGSGQTVQRLYGPRMVAHHRAEDPHRLELPWGPVWTLVFTGPKRRDWGFHTPEGWVYWRDFEARMGVDFNHGRVG